MIIRTILNIILILSISCTKDSNSEFATGTSPEGIVGKWKLVEFNVSDGTAPLIKNDVSSKNYIVTFDAQGNIKSSDFSCVGKYTFDKDKPGDRGDNNLVVVFDKCGTSETVAYSINGKADAKIVESNNLILNSATCDEPCTRVYRRLK